MAEAGRYLYAVTRESAVGALQGTGLQGGMLRSIDHEGLVAVVSDVDLEEFGEEGLKRNLEDLSWLEHVARTHDDVVRLVSSSGPVAPFRLATICVGDDGVRERLSAWHDQLEASLGRVEGRREWSVKAFVPRADDNSAPTTSTEPGSGAAYLRSKQESARRRRDLEHRTAVDADEVHRGVAELAEASRRLQPQDPRLTGHTETMVLNGAYLVPVAEEAAFVAAVERLSAAHPDLRMDVQGPWPPYSFATLEQS